MSQPVYALNLLDVSNSEQVVADLPDLDLEDVRQALAYAAALAEDEFHPIRA